MTIKRLAAITLLLLSACSGSDYGADGGAECDVIDGSAALDCSRVCRQYCNKLSSCGLSPDAECATDCETLLEAGASDETYTCVIDTPCEDISACGI